MKYSFEGKRLKLQ